MNDRERMGSTMDALRARLEQLRPLSQEQIAALRQSLRNAADIEFVYASNAIEGSRLTLRETQIVIEQGVTVAGKPLQDHLDAKNGAAAVELMRFIVESGEPLSANSVLSLHSRVLGAGDTRAGRIRPAGVTIAGSRHVPPAWPKVSDDFDTMLEQYRARRDVDHPVTVAADLHHKLVFIHPFLEGNGRTARLLQSVHLMQKGYPPLIIQPSDRLAYYSALEAADNGDLDRFRTFIADREAQTLKRYLDLIEDAPG